MDKFAVDLDQVLNDFEYSELTDQYSSTVRNPADTSSSVQHNVTKHSINNVFHSLNEYLNTSVEIPSENNIKTVGDEEKPFKNTETCYNKFPRDNSKKNIGNDGSNHSITILERQNEGKHENETKDCENDILIKEKHENDAGDCDNDVLIKEKDEIHKNDTGDCDMDILVNVKDKIHKNNDDCDNAMLIEEKDKTHALDAGDCENDKRVRESKEKDENDVGNGDSTEFKQVCVEMEVLTLADHATNCESSLDDCIKINKKEIEEDISDNESVVSKSRKNTESTKEDILIDFDISTDVSEDCKTEPKENLIQINVTNMSATENDITEEKEVSDIKDDEVLAKHTLDKSEELENSVVDKIINIVGFETVNDVHEEEMEDLLAELEGDQDLIMEESQILNEDVKKKQIEIEGYPHDNQIANETEEKLHKEEEPTPTISSSKQDTVTLSEPEHPVEDDIKIDKTKVEECEISKKKLDATSENVNNEKIVAEQLIEDTVTKDSINNVEDEEELSGKEEDEVETEIDKNPAQFERQDSTSRPQHLPLKEEEIEKQREINLIGDPGSTPYNNVYVNQEITKQERDTESISSTSSNSDTGSTVSTASTEEIRDDNDETNTNTKEQLVIAIENEQVENVEPSGDTTVEVSEVSGREENEDRPLGEVNVSSNNPEREWLGKEAPLWIPDSDTTSCLHCDMKFTVLKRRHHCRACGLVLCSKCCHLRFKLEYLDAEARVCNKCHNILNKDTNSSSSSDLSPDHASSPLRRPNPNNPLEYCSTISPLQQVGVTASNPVPAVMVPVGVLKRKGSNKAKSNKSVMFCDGIRPGSDLTNLDNDFNYNNTKTKKLEKTSTLAGKINRNLPLIDSETNSFIPKSENSLPPLVTIFKSDITYTDCQNNPSTVEMLKENQLTFALLLNLYVHLKIINMNCCLNKMAWCFSTEGLINVGQDEIVIILEYIDEESFVPKDVFYHINQIYSEAVKGTSVKEMGISLHNSSNFLDSKNHAGFVYIRPTFQCLENVIKPKEPYLIGILIHRWETPWAKLFPLRLILRLGAEYRYYPCPVISSRHRDSVFVEIGHTIINLLADFRNFSYTLPQINGLTIHMEDKKTTVTIPVNRYDQVIKSINNSSDHILAFGGTFSEVADSHLVCIQDTQGNENCYSTHSINIHNKPRKVTGTSFIVFNGALKSSSGLTAKSNIVEDGLMIQVLSESMQQIRDNLRAMKNHTISCGCVNADSDETVSIVWGENDVNFNIGVTSAIDGLALNGIPSIRVHNGQNYSANGNRIIKWTEVFIIQNDDDSRKNQDPIDISRLSEGIAKAVCDALVNYLDLLVTNNFYKIGIRTNLQVDNVSYCGGSNNTKLPPIYMKSLDNELIPVLHRLTSNNLGENCIILELIFRILNV
ncbi:zinc finger FYVE domain-containing protein 9 [Diorhabda sublineata]|uniref:zinc finger FYVE domain-containing protein 9 n=1 Tax=Diorhabda sublineata TaxID=1163346 RepID=UPI0024E0A23B|nr:zinc finger FYVE domain-containing protein 9 [Diorhabda sublineata]